MLILISSFVPPNISGITCFIRYRARLHLQKLYNKAPKCPSPNNQIGRGFLLSGIIKIRKLSYARIGQFLERRQAVILVQAGYPCSLQAFQIRGIRGL